MHRSDPPGRVERRVVREQRGGVAVLADPEQDDVEHDVGELALVGARGGLGAELALHAVRHRAVGDERLAHEPRVRLRVVRADAALVGEPQVHAAPVGDERPERDVGHARGVPAGERDVGRAALRERLADRVGEQLGGAPSGGAGVRLALDDDAGAHAPLGVSR